MKIGAIDINLEVLGSQFANMDSDEQTKFFRGLAQELKTWKNRHRAQLQFAYTGAVLTEEEKRELHNALELLWLVER